MDLEKFVGIDIMDSARGIEPLLARHEVGKKIKFHFNVSQSDERSVRKLIKSEFAKSPIDLIIDDASHISMRIRRELSRLPFFISGRMACM